jgi:hypothetical protein
MSNHLFSSISPFNHPEEWNWIEQKRERMESEREDEREEKKARNDKNDHTMTFDEYLDPKRIELHER